MQIDAILGLMRMTDDGNTIVANLARMILGLVEGVRDLEMRAGLAEAALDAERAKVTELQAQLRGLGGEAPISGSSVVLAPAMA